jgi:hypothetical protein
MCSSLFNIQEEFQAKPYSPKCLGEVEYDYKYHKLMYLFLI